MIFQKTWRKVVAGEKTQTRRLVKAGQALDEQGVRRPSDRKSYTYQIGKEYAVQPARTQKGLAVIRITGIRREDVREIRLADVTAEGFATREEFMEAWKAMHGEKYEAWVIDFEVVR